MIMKIRIEDLSYRNIGDLTRVCCKTCKITPEFEESINIKKGNC